MPLPFKYGEPVKLTAHGMRTCRKQSGEYKARTNLDWRTRRGVGQRYTGAGEAVVMWEGRSTPEPVPVMLLERV
jgi:hypothetical protein